ncbi:MAG: M23 family metallopeptidase [Planctomycetota bacterium]|jgi:murein DD-endopeptidase MepM/ murein hydrolase activator NlpD
MISRWDERIIRVDSEGDGHFAEPRGAHRHKGADYLFEEGEAVTSPVDGIVLRIGWAYKSEPYRLVEILSHKGYILWRFLYIEPVVKAGDKVKRDQLLGYAQAISNKYGDEMRDHVHVEMNIDPHAVIGGQSGN